MLGAACRHWPLALRFANDDAKADRAVVLEACKDCTFGSALQYAAEELRDDRAFVRSDVMLRVVPSVSVESASPLTGSGGGIRRRIALILRSSSFGSNGLGR